LIFLQIHDACFQSEIWYKNLRRVRVKEVIVAMCKKSVRNDIQQEKKNRYKEYLEPSRDVDDEQDIDYKLLQLAIRNEEHPLTTNSRLRILIIRK